MINKLKHITKLQTTEPSKQFGFEAIAIKKPAGVLPNIILGNRGIRRHLYWNNLLHKVYTYTNNHLGVFVSSYLSRFLLLLHLCNQQSCRRLLSRHLLSNISRQSKRCISFYKLLNELENYINHIETFKTTLRFERTPKVNSFFGFYVKQVFHIFSIIYYKYNKYNIQSQVVNKLALSF